MTYATPTDLIDEFDAAEIAQRADRAIPRVVTAEMLTTAAAGGDMSAYTQAEQDATAAALARVNRALKNATDIVNSRIGGRYQMPLVTVPAIIVRLTCDIARADLYDDQVTDVIKDRGDKAEKTLASIGKGEMTIGLDASGGKPSTAGSAQIQSVQPVFSRDNAKDFI